MGQKKDPLSDGDFDPTQKTEVLIYEDGVQVIRGAMQLRAVRLMAQVYEVNVLGDVADLFAEMGSKLLQAAFLDGDTYTTDYNYANTAANVILSQDLGEDITSGEVGDGTIIIPYADHGLSADQQPLSAQLNYGLKNPDSSVNGLYPEMLKPELCRYLYVFLGLLRLVPVRVNLHDALLADRAGNGRTGRAIPRQ